MGIYPNHAVEYWIEIERKFDNTELYRFIERLRSDTMFDIHATPSNNICVLSAARTDDRLVKSNYFIERKDDWFNDRTLVEEWREAIDEQSLVDIELKRNELKIIEKIKERLGEHIIYKGWFDVNTIGYLY